MQQLQACLCSQVLRHEQQLSIAVLEHAGHLGRIQSPNWCSKCQESRTDILISGLWAMTRLQLQPSEELITAAAEPSLTTK